MFRYCNKDRTKKRRVQTNFNELLSDPRSKGNPIFKNLLFYIDQDSVNVSRRGVLHRLIDKYGGQFTTNFCNSVTHVLVDEGFCNGRLSSTFTWTSYPPHMEVIMVTWLSASINANMCLNTAGYRIRSNRRPNLYENFHYGVQDAAYSSNGKDGSSEGTKFDYVSEENSTFDDGKYDDETSCEDEWLLSEPPDIYILPTNPDNSEWLPLQSKETSNDQNVIPDNTVVTTTTSAESKIDSPKNKVPAEAPFASSNPIVARLSKVRVRMVPKHSKGPGEMAVVVELNNENDPPLPFERTKNVNNPVDSLKNDTSVASNDVKNTSLSDLKATTDIIDTNKNDLIATSSTSVCEEVGCSPSTSADQSLVDPGHSKCINGGHSEASLEKEHQNEQKRDGECEVDSNDIKNEMPLSEKNADLIEECNVDIAVEKKNIKPSKEGSEEIPGDSDVMPECKESNVSEMCLVDERITQSNLELPSKRQEHIMESSCDLIDSLKKVADPVVTTESIQEASISSPKTEPKSELIGKDNAIESKEELIPMNSSEQSVEQSLPVIPSANECESKVFTDSSPKNLVEEGDCVIEKKKSDSVTEELDVKQDSNISCPKNESEENKISLSIESCVSDSVMCESKENFSNEKVETEQSEDISESETSDNNEDDEEESDFESSARESESKSHKRKTGSSSAEVSDETLTKKSKVDGEFTVEVIDSSEYSSDDSVVILSSECETMEVSTNNDSFATGSSELPSTDNNIVYPLNLYCSSTAGFADSEHMSCEESSSDCITSDINFAIQGPNGTAERIDSERFRECINNDTATYVIVNRLAGFPAHCLPPPNPSFEEYDTISTLDNFNKDCPSTSTSIINTAYEPPRSFSLTNISDPNFPFPIPEPSTSTSSGHFKALGHPVSSSTF